jgi:hypothetical protein
MKNKIKYWVYDYETYYNCFIAVYESLTSDERHIFIIHKSKNQLIELIDFLKQNIINKDWHLGYNCLAFDSQITEYILDNYERFEYATEDEITLELHKYGNYVIKKSDSKEFLDYPEFKLRIRNVDIYTMNYWQSSVKRSSLKWIQYAMDWKNIEETPHDFRTPVETEEELNSVIEYCINDVSSTKAVYLYKDSKNEKVMISQINLRAHLSHDFKINLYSAAEPKISKEVFLHFLSQKLNIDKRELREKRTYRNKINVKDIILPYINFKNKELNSVKEWFEAMELDSSVLNLSEEEQKTKGPKKRLKIKDCNIDYSMGGLHGVCNSGIYITDSYKTIKSMDVKSFYPNLAIKNNWHPAHIPAKDFCEQYQWFYTERNKYDKKNPLNYLYKIILNSSYGLSKNKYCFLYDPILAIQICVNGQLSLSMFIDMIMSRIPGAEPLMQNTDGCEFFIPNEYLNEYDNIIKEWEKITNLELEVETYKKMFIWDVNNYISVFENGKTKCKGRFEFEDLPLHKNKSNLIVPKAIYNYFINNIKPENYLKENRNIFDYCSGVKAKGDWRFWRLAIEKGQYTEEKLQKVIRYYISNKGCKIVKRHSDNREIQTESGEWMQTIFNKYVELPWEDYHVNDKYYLDKIYSEIYNIQPKIKNHIQLEFNL